MILLFSAADAYAWMRNFARADIMAENRQTVFETSSLSAGAKLDFFSWEKDGGKWGLCANFPASEEWKEGSFIFKASQETAIVITLRGPDIKDDGKTRLKIKVDYAKVELNGIELLNASDEKAVTAWHDEGKVLHAKLSADTMNTLKIRYRMKGDPKGSDKNFALNLRNSANMGFKDDIPGDGKGGWSDQGESDLRIFDVNRNIFGGMDFQIIRPESNKGKSVLTFASPNISNEIKLKEASAAGPNTSEHYRYLYLLHSSAWCDNGKEAGKIEIELSNGEVKTFPVKAGVEFGDWASPVNLPNGIIAWTGDCGDKTAALYMSRFQIDDFSVPVKSVHFKSSESGTVWIIIAATLSNNFIDFSKYQNSQKPVTIRANEEWRIIDMTDLNVKEGSALDLSRYISKTPVDKQAKLAIKDGGFVLSRSPEKRIRFTGCSINLMTDLAPLDKEGIKEYVRLAARQGYNMFRAHFLDMYLMWEAEQNLEFNPVRLDKFEYLVKCMKDEGLYLSMDAMSAPSGYFKRKNWNYNGIGMGKHLLFDNQAREQWKTGVTKLLSQKNPYTGLSLAEDPVLVNLVLYNEQDMGRVLDDMKPFKAQWKSFLVKKYGSESAVLSMYNEGIGASSGFKKIDEITPNTNGKSRLSVDSREFVYELYKDMDEFFRTTLKEIYSGWTSQYDCNPIQRFGMLRYDYPVTCMHSYHAHPDKYIESGSRASQRSAAKSEFRYFTQNGLTRFSDRPFMITEILHVFWNKYRYEQGLMLGAYSAFQDYDCLIPHSGPVMFKGAGRVNPFGTGSDPVDRASEFVTNYLFHSGAVKTGKRKIEFEIKSSGMLENGLSEESFIKPMYDAVLMSRSGCNYPDLKRPVGIQAPADTIKIPVDYEQAFTKEYTDKIYNVLLADGNQSKPAEGIFVTDGNQIKLDSRKGSLQVQAETFEGMSQCGTENISMPSLKILNPSVPASFSLMSLDTKSLESSKRLLFVVATDAVNDGITFADEERTILLKLSQAPILLRTIKATVQIKSSGKNNASIYSLRMNGERADKISSQLKNGFIEFQLDTSKLQAGPSVFFEIVKN